MKSLYLHHPNQENLLYPNQENEHPEARGPNHARVEENGCYPHDVIIQVYQEQVQGYILSLYTPGCDGPCQAVPSGGAVRLQVKKKHLPQSLTR